MIITISGKPGSGKSTVADILAQKLRWDKYSIGDLRRKLAEKRGMTIQEYNKLGETDPSTDKEVDKYQEKLGKTKDNLIIEGRISFKFIPHSFKVYLDVNGKIAAQRIFSDIKKHPEKRNEGIPSSLADVEKSIRERVASDRKRYEKYYNIDCYDASHYDLVIDTSRKTPEKVAEEILARIKNKRYKQDIGIR